MSRYDNQLAKQIKSGTVHSIDANADELPTDEVLARLRNNPEALKALVDDYRLLHEAIEKSPVAYCLYDDDNRLVVSNPIYEKLHPALADLKRQKRADEPIYYAEVVRQQLHDTVPPEALEAEVAKRVALQDASDGEVVERDYANVGRFRVSKIRLSTNGSVGIAFDITELARREQDLRAAKSEAEVAGKRAHAALMQERRRKSNARHMAELGEWLQSCNSLDELLRVVERFMARMFPGTSGELYIYSNSRDVLDIACYWNVDRAIDAHIRPDDCWALRRGRVLRFGAGIADLACAHAHDLSDVDPCDAPYICIPIIAHGDTVGLLHIRSAPKSDAVDAGFEDTSLFADESLAVQCAEQISLAVANVRLRDELHELSLRDPLTGLFNRRHFMSQFRQALVAFERSQTPVSVISLDADKFKSFNDLHGHEAGDTVLCELAETFRKAAPDQALVARVGGEEFCILLPGVSGAQAEMAADIIRTSVEDMKVHYAKSLLPSITISAGVAEAGTNGAVLRDILLAADNALYTAKESGRNCIVVAAAQPS